MPNSEANVFGLTSDLNDLRSLKHMRRASDILPISITSSSTRSTNLSELSPQTSSLTYIPYTPLFKSKSRFTTAAPTNVPSNMETTRPSRATRKQCESRIPFPDLYARMGLAHDPDKARSREQHILRILADEGFPIGERKWIRDTEAKERQRIIEKKIYCQARELYGYTHQLLELIVRRAVYYLMQGHLRRLRRSQANQQHLARQVMQPPQYSSTVTKDATEDATEEESKQFLSPGHGVA
ncbi:hypothetical protein V1520DRAFT_133870 [Lipomyces starkeyi]|uniref:Uncharacterized protein n=1 Tax=Lipomyces starkeyi NRRL Y-11557 TaxID=675824 RepID=A0A1E3Q008_LIPST|nr:hypothetical protein LIPSTDRAFT_107056 [Lipomyces starkeyi NRRL Y-11557]